MQLAARTPIDIGLIIRDRRHELGLDQGELARRVGVSRQWIVEIEKGKSRAEIGLVLRTFNVLDLRLSIVTDMPASTQQQGAIPSIDIDAVLDDLKSDPW